MEENPVTTAHALARAIAASGISKHQLAKLLAGPDADIRDVMNLRRQVYGWLNGTQPREKTARRLEEILGLVPGSLSPEATGHAEAYKDLQARMAEREAEAEELRRTLAEQRERLERLERLLSPPPGSQRSFQ